MQAMQTRQPASEGCQAQKANQFSLMIQRRFAPYFWTQFGGAANDNLFKFAFTVWVTYRLQSTWLTPDMAGLVIGALFILPFLLFSATAGQWADKVPKHMLMRGVKNLEVMIMLLAAWGFVSHQVSTLLLCTFLMGLHSTIFGPAKYAYLPQVLQPHELTGGNGMVEMGTFVAILLGNVAGGLLIALPSKSETVVGFACVAVALLGRLTAQAIPEIPANDPELRICWNPWVETWRNLRLAQENRSVWGSLLGISWMWFFGAVFLSQFPSFAHDVLHGDEQVASLLLVVFSVGIGLGSVLCETLSRQPMALGLSPVGALGMSAWAIDLGLASTNLPAHELWSLREFVSTSIHHRILLDLLGLSVFAGLYSVPMYTLIQMRSPPSHRSRIIAANNILNAGFMICSAIVVGLLIKMGVRIAEVFFYLGLANAVVVGGVLALVPEYGVQCLAWLKDIVRLVRKP
jgi:MFS family permease